MLGAKGILTPGAAGGTILISYEYFIVLSEELNFSKAAQRLGISQPSLSAYVKRLETHLSVPLLQRTPKLALTPAGKLTAEAGRKILSIYQSLEQDSLYPQEAEAPKPFRIGLARPLASSNQSFFSLNLLTKKFPSQQFSIIEGSYQGIPSLPPESALKKRLAANQLSCVICQFSPIEAVDDHAIHLFSAPEYLIIADSLLKAYYPHPDPRRWLNGVDLLDFAHIPQIAHASVSPTQTYIIDYFKAHEKAAHIVSIVNNPLTIYAYVESGMGWARTSEIFFPEKRNESVWAFPIISPVLRYDYYLRINPMQTSYPNYNDIIQELTTYIKNTFSNRSAYVYPNL